MEALAMTGLGVVSPVGVGRRAFEAALRDEPAARTVAFGSSPTVLPSEQEATGVVAEVWNFDASHYLGDKGLRNFDRLTRMLIVAAKHALEDANIKADGAFIGTVGPDHIGICSATAYGSLDVIMELSRVAELEDPRYINPARFPNTVINAAAGYVSIWEDLRAPNTTIVDGNCGALDAVLTASTHLAHRRAQVFLVGGGEVVSESLFVALRKLGVLRQPDRIEGTGFRIGEGAAYVCVERDADARARGVRPIGHIRGYGTAFDPPESEARLAHGSADAVARAIEAALHDAGLSPENVDVVISSHAGVTELDEAERQGIERALGAGVAICTPKQTYGETFGAGGALQLAHAVALFSGVPPAPCLTTVEAPSTVSTVVLVTVGFYGNVTSVVVTKA